MADCIFNTVDGKYSDADMEVANTIVNGWLPKPVTAKDGIVLRDRIAAALYNLRRSAY